MPLVDMPLEQLYSYEGRNPKPADFENYWDSSLDEMHALNSKVELIPFDFPSKIADCYDLWFIGTGGARVHAQYLRPKNLSGKCPAIVQFHGYSWYAGEWQDKIAMVSQGYCVAALDVRGQGGQSQDLGGTIGRTHGGHFIHGIDDADPKKMLFRSVFLDCAQLAGIVMGFSEVDESNVSAFGGSQGGALTLACAALEPRIARAFSIHPFLSDYKRVWEMDLASGAYQEIKDYFRQKDPTHAREDAIFERLGYIDIQHLAPRIKAKVWMGCGLMDTICPPSTQFAVYNKITSQKQVTIWPDFAHEVPWGGFDGIYRLMNEM